MKHNYEFRFRQTVLDGLSHHVKNVIGIRQPVQVRTGMHRLWQFYAHQITDLTTGQVIKDR